MTSPLQERYKQAAELHYKKVEEGVLTLLDEGYRMDELKVVDIELPEDDPHHLIIFRTVIEHKQTGEILWPKQDEDE